MVWRLILCVNLAGMPKYLGEYYFGVGLWGCFQDRLAFKSVDSMKMILPNVCGHPWPPKGCAEREGGGRRWTPSLCVSWAVHLLPSDTWALVWGLLDLGHDLHCWPLILRPLSLDWMAPLASLTPACRWQILGLRRLHTMIMAYKKNPMDCWPMEYNGGLKFSKILFLFQGEILTQSLNEPLSLCI